MRCFVLGPVRLRSATGEIALGGGKQRALFALLVSARGQVVPTGRIIDELWGERPPAKAGASVQSYVANLRRALRAAGPDGPALNTRTPGYVLDAVPTDATEFETMLDDAARADPRRACQLLDAALALWDGENAYADVAQGSATLTAEAIRLDELRTLAIERRWQALLELGAHERIVGELETALRANPLRENVWRLLALALYRSGRQGDALAALARARRELAAELGVDPGPRLRELETAILHQDPALVGSTTKPATRLVGRGRQLAELRAALDAPSGRVAAVFGEPGIGKTALAQAVTDIAETGGVRTGWGTADESGAAPALWPMTMAFGDLLIGLDGKVRGWLRTHGESLHPILPQFDDAAPESRGFDADTVTFRTARTLTGLLRDVVGPSLVVLDDLHWADETTLRLLRALLPLLPRTPTLVIVTARDTVTHTSAGWDAVLGDLRRHAAPGLRLRGLDTDDIAELVAETPDVGDPAALRDQTGGNPFYLGEVIAMRRTDPTSIGVPDGVRDLVRRRLAALPAEAESYLITAAVAGQRFSPELVGAVSDLRDPEVAASTAMAAGLLVPDSQGGLRFRHALVRDAVAERIPATHRRRLHAALAAAANQPAVAAHHYAAAGPEFSAQAVQSACLAAEAAEQSGEACRMYELARAAAVDPGAALLVALARAQKRVGKEREAWAAASTAATAALDAGDTALATEAVLTVATDAIWSWREYQEVDYRAIALLDRLIDATTDPVSRAHLQSALAGELYYWPERAARAADLVEQACTIMRTHGSHTDLARVLELRHVSGERPALLGDRAATATELVNLAERRYDEIGLCRALIFRGRDRFEAGEFASGHADYERASRIARRIEFVPVLVVLAWWAAAAAIAMGRYEEAAVALDEAEQLHRRTTLPGAESIPLLLRASFALASGTLGDAVAELTTFAHASDIALVVDLAALAIGDRTDVTPADPPPDYLWLAHQAVRALILARGGDSPAARRTEAALRPYAGRIVLGGTGICILGAVDHYLGRLAMARGDTATARGDLIAAAALERACGLIAFARRTEAASALLDPE